MCKKLLTTLMICVSLVGLVGCGKTTVKIKEKETTENNINIEEVKEEPKGEVKEEILNGNEINILHRPVGDYSLQFTATIINNTDYGNVLRIAYDINNISFKGSAEDTFGNIYEDVCWIDLGYDYTIKVVDEQGNVLNPCGTGYEDEIIPSEPVYIGTTGHFAQTFFINEGVEMNNIEILFKIPDDNYKFNVNITQ